MRLRLTMNVGVSGRKRVRGARHAGHGEASQCSRPVAPEQSSVLPRPPGFPRPSTLVPGGSRLGGWSMERLRMVSCGERPGGKGWGMPPACRIVVLWLAAFAFFLPLPTAHAQFLAGEKTAEIGRAHV